MHTLITIPTLCSCDGGPSRVVPAIADELSSNGIDVSIFFKKTSRENCHDITPCNNNIELVHEITRFDYPIAGQFFRKREIIRQLSNLIFLPSNKIDIVHDHGLWSINNLAAYKFATKTKVPYVLSVHGMLEEWSLNQKKIKKWLALELFQRNILENASLLFANSEQEVLSIRRMQVNTPIALIPNGINPRASNSKFLLKNFDKTKKHVLFLSRVHPKKGLINFLNAWSVVRPKGWKFIIAGPDDNYIDTVLEGAKELNLLDEVEYIGNVSDEDKWNVYDLCDLFVLPTFSENFGIVVAEALSRGLPVMTTTGTPWSDLETCKCGWWVAPDVKSLSGALRLATNLKREDYLMMKKNAINLASNFDWPLIGKKILQSYLWVKGDVQKPEFIDLE